MIAARDFLIIQDGDWLPIAIDRLNCHTDEGN